MFYAKGEKNHQYTFKNNCATVIRRYSKTMMFIYKRILKKIIFVYKSLLHAFFNQNIKMFVNEGKTNNRTCQSFTEISFLISFT